MVGTRHNTSLPIARSLQSVLNAAARLLPSATARPHLWCVGDTALAARHRTRAVQNRGDVSGFDFRRRHFISACNQPPRSTQLHDSAPRYLGPLVAVADLPGRRTLRLASTSCLAAPPIKLSTVGSHAFPVTATQVWDGLPWEKPSSYRHHFRLFAVS